MHRRVRQGIGWVRAVGVLAIAACSGRIAGSPPKGSGIEHPARVDPGITVLLDDSIQLVGGKRVGLLTNQASVDRDGRTDIELLRKDRRATQAGVRLVALFSPEHGIGGTEDRQFIESGVDAKSGLPVVSLYGETTLAPPDSALRGLDVLVFDLPDIGTRTWTYEGNLVYALRAARRAGVRVVVLDRPAPLTGSHADGPMLDSSIANAEEQSAARPAQPYALYPLPLRHGMTMGELALLFNRELGIGADLVVVPMRHWRRDMWYDDTELPWVRPSPSMPSLASALVYPALVAFEASNVSVGRGTATPFQRFGAPWLNARRTAKLLNERGLEGVRFEPEPFTPRNPGDKKYADREIPGVRVVVTDRDVLHTGRLGAAILWALHETAGDSLRIAPRDFDLRFGSPAARQALLSGDDPDAVIDRTLPAVIAFTARTRRYHLYK